MLGSLCASWSGDRVGRRDSLSIACVVFVVGSVIISAVQNQAMLIVARIINGFAVGMLTSLGCGYCGLLRWCCLTDRV